jgi:hypothetical protein
MEPLHFNDYRDPQLVIFVEVNGVNINELKIKIIILNKKAIMYMNIL